jgi:ketosteroid isomerase-like protein
MSDENVEIVRRHLEALRSETPQLALGYMRDDVEFDASTRPDGKVWHGHDGAREALGEWREIWDEYELKFGDVVDASPDKVVALWSESGRARQSGAFLSQDGATVFTLADGVITHVLVSVDPHGVLARLGVATDPRAGG